jgi:hypothetical protein
MIKSKRGSFTKYLYEQALVYEYRGNFFIIQRGQQGVKLNPEHGDEQRAAESVKLYAELSSTSEDNLLGSKIIDALNLFDTEPPEFNPWENTKLGGNLKKWLKARGQNDIKINTRLIDVTKRLDRGGSYEITPYDNFNLNPWCGPMTQQCMTLSPSASILDIGKAARRAFEIATHHPNYLA